MRIAIVYHSGSGNTKALAEEIATKLPEAELFRVTEFDMDTLTDYDGLLIGTYTWADGDIPRRLLPLYAAIEEMNTDHLVTAVFGTGETGYRHFCGAVDSFRDMLNVHTQLVATLKVEQKYQEADLERIEKLCKIIRNKLLGK